MMTGCWRVCCRCRKVHGRERPRVYQRVRRAAGRVRRVQAQHGIPRRLPDPVPEKVRCLLRRTRPGRLRPGNRRGVGNSAAGHLGHRSWMSYIRDFGRWLRARGHADAYVLSGKWKAPIVPARPYLLTKREIEAFFAAAARLDATSPWRWQAVAFFM